MTNFTTDDSMCRVDFFKPNGKWYATEAVCWRGGWDGDIYSCFALVLIRHLEDKPRHIGMTAMCLEPWHEHSHPVSTVVEEGWFNQIMLSRHDTLHHPCDEKDAEAAVDYTRAVIEEDRCQHDIVSKLLDSAAETCPTAEDHEWVHETGQLHKDCIKCGARYDLARNIIQTYLVGGYVPRTLDCNHQWIACKADPEDAWCFKCRVSKKVLDKYLAHKEEEADDGS